MCTFLVAPYTVFPLAAGIPIGFLSSVGVPAIFQAFALVIVGAITGMSIVGFFANRANSMTYGPYSQSIGTRVRRYLHLAINYISAFLFMIPVYCQLPSQQESVNHTLNVLPCLPEQIWSHPNYFLVSTNNLFFSW
ncbi:unnamed protein product [Caenorhabditis sp. 36 PRJEB53466]|nr:unnamed protein product [Caenorhabditis sp. 36 PRJEB53466]